MTKSAPALQSVIVIELEEVPRNVLNTPLPHVRPREDGPSRWSIQADWRELAIDYGRRARQAAGWPVAARGDQRIVEIQMFRHRRLDKASRYIATKPVVDAMQTEWTRTRIGKIVVPSPGAGLIWTDDDDHCELHCLKDVLVPRAEPQRTVITVRMATW